MSAEPSAGEPKLIGIAGFSCSGKTTLARQLATRLNSPILPLDAYYSDLAHLEPAARAQTNFDTPTAIDFPLLLEHLQCLARGEAIARPEYDFATHTQVPATQQLAPATHLIVEGLFALHWPEIRALYQLAVFVAAPHALCLERRLRRDVAERGRTPSSVREQYQRHVQPMAERYIAPTQRHADLVVSGQTPVAESIERLLALC